MELKKCKKKILKKQQQLTSSHACFIFTGAKSKDAASPTGKPEQSSSLVSSTAVAFAC